MIGKTIAEVQGGDTITARSSRPPAAADHISSPPLMESSAPVM